MRILQLPHNPVPVYYPGGSQIREYRGISDDGYLMSPEDWLGSTTVLRSPVEGKDQVVVGHSAVADGRTVLDVMTEDPGTWAGSSDKQPKVDFLVKLLDPAERVPVHWHPNAAFAQRHLGMIHGKAEAWLVLSQSARVWLGLTPGTTVAGFEAAIRSQDVDWMLSHMHVFELKEGDTVFIPPGVLHAIDAGALMVEVQEPTSVSILAEHARLGVGELNASLGAGWEAALSCLIGPSERESLEGLLGRVSDDYGQTLLLPPESNQFFRCWVLNVNGADVLAVDGVSVVLVDRGPLRLVDTFSGTTSHGERGSAWLIGGSVEAVPVEGVGRLLMFSGPKKEASKPQGGVNNE